MDEEKRAETEYLVESVVNRTTPIVVRQTLLSLGLDADEPTEIQKDHAYLRRKRKSAEDRRRWASRAVITGLIGWLTLENWKGVIRAAKAWLGGES
ncbi:MAG: hypothetical protein ACLFQ3_09620 [Thiohalorhabdus sp.]